MTQRETLPSAGRLPLLDNDVLRSFVAIAERGSFTHAAKEVFRSPSALSMQIKNLEKTLGASMFLREPRRVRLTPQGELLLGYARRLLRLNEDAVAAFLCPVVTATVRLGLADDLGVRLLPRILAGFARAHPGVQVDVVTGLSRDLYARLERNELDVVLVTTGHPSIVLSKAEVLFAEPLVWAGLRGGVAAARHPLPLALADHGCAWRALALTALERSQRTYRVAYSSEHCAGQKAAVLADLAIAPLPVSLIDPALEILDESHGLAPIGDCQVAMLRAHDAIQTVGLCAQIRRAFDQMPRMAIG